MNPNNEQFPQIPDSPLFVCEANDPKSGLKGWLTVHTIGQRGSCGGIRLYPDVTKEETVVLAKAMTYKYCMSGYTLGGAKGAVRMPFDIDDAERRMLLESFGRHIGPLIKSKIYQPWTDMNCSVDDLRSIYNGAGKQLKFVPADSAYSTALSTFSALLAVVEHLGIKSEQCTVAIEGFGNVGSQLALEIDRWGGKIIAVSNRRGTAYNSKGLDAKTLYNKRKQFGDMWIEQQGDYERLACEQLFSLDTTIHVPCARVHSLTADNIAKLNCRAVVQAANEPCAPCNEPELFKKGILSLPYFAVNIGGITGSGLASVGVADEQIRQVFTGEFHQMVARLLKISEQGHESPVEVASREAAKCYHTLFESANPVKTRKSLLSKLGIATRSSPKQKIKELKSTFNSRFTSSEVT
ncbi:MAG: Glu/Leu/Phe/Val dehydrogenase dimerization domain-containing protein [Sedimentisphaerales bacterium]|jgi:glutamate dehydrogenase/leucine dehydrogenase